MTVLIINNVDAKTGCEMVNAFHKHLWFLQTFSLALVVATLYYGGYLVTAGEMTGGDLISFILYQMNLGFQFSVSLPAQ